MFHFPRQVAGERLSLADFVAPGNGARAATRSRVLITTAGEGVRGRRRGAEGTTASTCSATALQALAVETAEAAAEWLHAKLRAAVGVPGSAGH